MDLENPGVVGCAIEALQTSTTLVTVIRSSSTLVETEQMVFTTTSTAILAETPAAVGTGPQLGQAAFANNTNVTDTAPMSTSNQVPAEVLPTSSNVDQESLATRTDTVIVPQVTSNAPLSDTIHASLNAKTEGPTTGRLSSAPGPETTALTTVTNQEGELFQNTSGGAKLSCSVLPVALSVVSTLTVISSVSTCSMNF